MKGLTTRFLEGLAETVDSLNSRANPTFFNPTIAVLSALILTGTTAFSYDFRLPALVFFMSVALVLITRCSVHKWIRVIIFILVWATVVSAPLPFITFGDPLANLSLGLIQLTVSREGVNLMITFISRVVASVAIFTSFVSIMGWRRTIMGLEGLRMPRELALLLNLSIIHIPLFLRESSKMLSAREARVMRKITFKELWKVLATVVGDLLLRSHERAWRLEKAIKARSFASEPSWRSTSISVGIKDLFLLSLTLSVLLLGVLDGL